MPSRVHEKGRGTAGADVMPGQYPLGSPQSRAAARAVLTARRAGQFEGILVQFVSALGGDDLGRRCTCPAPAAGTIAFCRCFE